jgi:hypothetical protein
MLRFKVKQNIAENLSRYFLPYLLQESNWHMIHPQRTESWCLYSKDLQEYSCFINKSMENVTTGKHTSIMHTTHSASSN